jgi:hypothetical protein
MSHDRGVRAQRWLAAYLSKWWPDAVSTGSGRRGADVENTPGVAWEMKTASEFRPLSFVEQAAKYAGGCLPVVVYLPNGCGEQSIGDALAFMPLHRLMDVLQDAGYAPEPRRGELAEVGIIDGKLRKVRQ